MNRRSRGRRGARGAGGCRWVALVATAALAIAGCKSKATPTLPPPEVLVVDVVQRDVPIYSEWVGTTDGYVDAQIRPKVQGYILKQNYQNGSVVKSGDLLFEIDPRQFQAALDEANGQLGRAQAQLKKTELDVARYRPLVATGAVSQKELDDAVQQNAANRSAVYQAQAALEQAQLNLAWTKVQSPIDGIAGINQAQIGDLVGTTTLLTTVSTVEPIKVQFPISEQQYLKSAALINEASNGRFESAPPLELILANDAVYAQKGRVYAVNRQVEVSTGTILVQAVFPNPDNMLRPGGYAKVRMATDLAKNALVVPQRAVLDLQGTYQMYVLNGDKVEVRDVQPGPRSGSDWVITKGLQPGEKVVVEGLQKVRNGVTVVAKPAPPDEPPGMRPSTGPASGAATAGSAS